jgi:hypothetical protein
MPLPIFAPDEGAYLVRALYPDNLVANNPAVAAVINGAHLSVIRAVYMAGAPFIIGDRLANSAAYLGGLLLLWRITTRGLFRGQRVALLLLAVAFAYYRFAFSNLAEGLFVGVLSLICVVSSQWYRTRPVAHALVAGGLMAILVLVKPHGIAVLAGMAVLASLDALTSRDWRRLPLRVALFAAAFFALGNLIQVQADEPVANPLTFFVGNFYGGALAIRPPPQAMALAALALGAMGSAVAVLAGVPIVIGIADIFRRWRSDRGRFAAEGTDIVFVLLIVSLTATLAMVTVFTMKVAWEPSQTKLLWGRYFEFYAPLLWLAAAPTMARPAGRGVRFASAGVMLAGLVGLMISFRAGIVLFPWDASILTAFFHSDPIRAPMDPSFPYRALAITATVLAAAALVFRLQPVQAGLGLILALSALSTWLDHVWLGPLVAQHDALEGDLRQVRSILPPVGDVVVLAPDANDGQLVFLRLEAKPLIYLGPPSQIDPDKLVGAAAVVVDGPETPPGGSWSAAYRGERLSLWRRP